MTTRRDMLCGAAMIAAAPAVALPAIAVYAGQTADAQPSGQGVCREARAHFHRPVNRQSISRAVLDK